MAAMEQHLFNPSSHVERHPGFFVGFGGFSADQHLQVVYIILSLLSTFSLFYCWIFDAV